MSETVVTNVSVSVEAILPNGVKYWTECRSYDASPVADRQKQVNSMLDRCFAQLDKASKKNPATSSKEI